MNILKNLFGFSSGQPQNSESNLATDISDTNMKNVVQPQILSEVIQTIAKFKDSKGSLPSKIIKHIQTSTNLPAAKIKKAIVTGLKSGIIKAVGGKFKLGLQRNELAVFRSFLKTDAPVKQVRRRGRRGGSRRRGRRRRSRKRRHSTVGDKQSEENTEVTTHTSKTNTGKKSTKGGEVKRLKSAMKQRGSDDSENDQKGDITPGTQESATSRDSMYDNSHKTDAPNDDATSREYRHF